MELNIDVLLKQIIDPRSGLPILGMLILLNAICGVLVGLKQQAFSRHHVLTFLQKRVMQQGLPIALTGFGAVYLDMYLLSWFYAASAAVMGADLAMDLVEKQKALFKRQ